MDVSTSETSGQKKDPLEDLSREELIKKCRQFLAIAQKAKQAKDEITCKLDEVETKSSKDVKTMQEMLNVLTEQKLELVTKIDIFQKEKNDFKNKYEVCQLDLQQITIKMQNIDTENQGYGRQVRRLTEENDQLITHLDTLEKRINELNKIGDQQREQLLLLEKQQINNSDNKNYEEMEELRLKCSNQETEISDTKLILTEQEQIIVNLKEEIDLLNIKNEQVVQLKNYCQLKTIELESLQLKNQELVDLKNKNEIILTETKNELIDTKLMKEKYNEKCKLFSKNIQQISTDVLELKKFADDLLLTFQFYEQYINSWKSDIIQVINKFGEEVQNRDYEIEKMKFENNNLNTQNVHLHKNTEKIVEKLQENEANNEKLNIIIEELKTKVQLTDILVEEKSALIKELNTLKTQLREKDVKSDLNLLELNVANLEEEISVLQRKYEEVKEQILLHEEKCSRNVLEMRNQIFILNEENKRLKISLCEAQNNSKLYEEMREENIILKSSLAETQTSSRMYEEMQDKNRALREDNDHMQSSLSDAQKYATLYEEMGDLNRILNEENNTLKSSLSLAQNNSEAVCKELQHKNHILNEENCNLKSSLSEAEINCKMYEGMRDKNLILNEDIDYLKNALSEAQSITKMYEEMRDKSRALYEENDNFKIALSEAQNYYKMYDEMQNKNSTLHEEINNLKISVCQAENNSKVYEEMRHNYLILTEENNNLKSSLSEVQNNTKMCEELRDKTRVLNEENDILKSALCEAENNSKMYKEKTEEELNKNRTLNEENNKLKSDLSEAQNNSAVYEEKADELKNITEKHETELVEGLIKSQEEKILLLSQENSLLKNTISGGAKHLEMLTASLSDKNTLESENLRLKSDLSDEKEKNSDLRSENTVARKLNIELQQTSTSLEEAILRNVDFLKIIEELRDQIENHYIGKKVFENASKSLTALNETNTALKEKLNKYEENITSYSRDCSDLRNQLSLSKRANAQLLEEMNEMNLALKERGETISKLQEIYQELQKQTKTLEQESQTWCKEKGVLEQEVSALKESQISAADREENTSNKALVAEKQKIIQDLEGEIKVLKESLNTSIGRDITDGGYGENETMSTSTISRTEDVARMRDLEGSWEERYAKLRTLALKLKGKVKELTGQLTQERTEKNELQNKISVITKNLQSVQTEYDKIQDQFENLDKEYKKKTKQINEQNKFKLELNDSKETSSKLQQELDSLRKEKIGSNTAVKQYTTQIQNLKKEFESANEKIKDLVNKLSKLEGNITTKENELQNEIKNHNSTKEKLQKIEKEIKKTSVLSLEMDDYERSLKDLSQKLEKKNETLTKLEQEIETLNATISSLKTQIKTLESETQNQELKYQGLKQQLSEYQAKISCVEAAKAQKDNRIREVLQSYEDYKISSEERNCDLSRTVTENQKALEVFRTEKDHFKSVILGLEDKIRELTKLSNDQGQELLHVKDEFSNYKVRAQSVLRQNQTRDVANEERLAEEVNELKIQIDSLTVQLNETTLKLRTITSEYEITNTEKTKIVLKFEETEKLWIQEKENNKYLVERQKQLITEHKEAFRAQKVHLDTLTQCYKQQITEQEERHVKEMTELKAAQAHFTSQAVAKAHEEAVDIASIPREDGEGSESVGSNYAPFRTSVLSLDKLLNADVESNFDYEAELSHCKKKLTEYEAKIIHLTDLLADTEQDLAKHSQLNQHLKDEIRRHQRSVEREKHAENLEYLKNVVFKFLTLNSGDEKSHLVPVLNTILKLSPDETQKLNAVASGTDATARGWGSYIPLWKHSNN